MIKYGILSNNRRSKLHAVIDCLFFLSSFDTRYRCVEKITTCIGNKLKGELFLDSVLLSV